MIQEEANFEDSVDWVAQYSAARRALSEVVSGHVEQMLKTALLEGELEKAQKTIGKIAGEHRAAEKRAQDAESGQDAITNKLAHLSTVLIDNGVLNYIRNLDDVDVDQVDEIEEAIDTMHRYGFIPSGTMKDGPEDGWSGENDVHTQTS